MEQEIFNQSGDEVIKSNKKRKWKRFIFVGGISMVLFLVVWGVYKTSNILTISGDVGVYKDFKLDKEKDRLDILILGIRGAKDENGGLLADTMILVSFDKNKEKAAILSLPRDLLVAMPDHSNPERINFAYALGEQRHWGGGGLALSKEVVKYVTGVYVDHAIVVNFDGFKKLIDTLGGVKIERFTEFIESEQWQGEGIEGSPFWELANDRQVSEDKGENIQDESDVLSPELDQNRWVFKVPAGISIFDGESALYYVRSRFSSSDFDRIKRQQQVVASLKDKTLSLGVLGNPLKIFNVLDILGDNVRTDMSLGDVREYASLVQKYDRISIETGILDTSPNGLLVSKTINGSFVLLPVAGDTDFSEIREFFKGIFN
ncbi:MAG: hypothetical protein A3F94_00950 [Candidatus Spechtbacteria bacterium RIFCSPLOWO2_12_FULL_38_22]|uniref:Cell envelope-related transcriptional attenuator domain-containing protein n=1 Tax=Candidatus Spechtbacteria bacterium RIFCSPLOWO2_12_FULL_38_22 TaxID=1802165 RepID=A0A1G2HIN8_9BACT|nr:MAG: hypothetical protein A2728_01840 [Candidatus Spechtbacteria bacterium RIFCSPHIGHO2_01_FULL_38_11]OGZ59472.1 MAG: hypothetical protein A3E58_00825 [Candidatus Spechtbacteria bacterium RIFCSPHIGHO2_12_FULL_38_30]OGZ61748.1 MAG: hypothetical protein A3F94_00950 [Candidatus Spechtbacteria bacterium RIFCSPLOWO2_12_FULL_38_22]